MIGYTTIGTNDFERAAAFYDALLGEVGAKRALEMDRFILWMNDAGHGGVAIAKPFDGSAATVGNGVMLGIACNSREQADQIHAKAMELGCNCEGAPGQRMDGFYAGYFRDLEGNKLSAYYMGE